MLFFQGFSSPAQISKNGQNAHEIRDFVPREFYGYNIGQTFSGLYWADMILDERSNIAKKDQAFTRAFLSRKPVDVYSSHLTDQAGAYDR